MVNRDKDFLGSIPEIYDTYLVPLIFESYAQDLADRVSVLGPDAILETAAGSGVVARVLAPVLPASAHYTATDLNQPMLDHAASKQQSNSRITWRQADALNLPFDDASFDVVEEAAATVFPDNPPRFLSRTPHGYFEEDLIQEGLVAAVR